MGVVGLGAWQLGADWGDVNEDDALAVLRAAVEAGVTFIDTADVYGDGRSERLIGQLLQEPDGRGHRGHQDGPPGRPARPETTPWTTSGPGPTAPGRTSAWTPSTWSSCTARRPPVYSTDAVFDALDTLVAEGGSPRTA